MGLADAMMMRGLNLRILRRLADDDEAQRLQESLECKDEIITLPSGSKLLKYDSFLQQQTYYDDLKHANVRYIDFGYLFGKNFTTKQPQLVIEQDKVLGKGGLVRFTLFTLIATKYTVEHRLNNYPFLCIVLGCSIYSW